MKMNGKKISEYPKPQTTMLATPAAKYCAELDWNRLLPLFPRKADGGAT
jgi:hypothetical protein